MRNPEGRIVMLASLTLGLLASSLYFRHVFSFRDAYLRSQQADYVEAPRQHPMWHSIYIGLGFVSNPYVAGGYCDQVAVEKVRSISPHAVFLSPEYDRDPGRSKCVSWSAGTPRSLLVNLAAKAGILQLLALLAGNFGLLAALCERKRWSLDLGVLDGHCFRCASGPVGDSHPQVPAGLHRHAGTVWRDQP